MSKKSNTNSPSNKRAHELGRRSFLKIGPVVGVSAILAPHLELSSLAQTPSPSPLPSPSPSPTPLRVTKEMLQHTEKLIGIELTDAQEAMALQNASANLDRYDALRKIDIPLDTEPATLFHPALPGKKLNSISTKF